MSAGHDDYLWDPSTAPVESIERIERLLRPLGAKACGLSERDLPLPQSGPSMRAPRRLVPFVAIAASLVLLVYAVHVHRLSWRDGLPWPGATTSADGTTRTFELHVGERVATGEDETATLEAARIGTVTIAANSAARLVRTRKGQHRIELEHGRIHAKIWAPPSYFGVTHGDMRFTDLGCEFDLAVASGSGSLAVASGWVIYRHGEAEILVPEHYALAFDAAGARVPLRMDAPAALRARVIELDAKAGTGDVEIASLAQAIAADARDVDLFTLLNLLIRHPRLADGPLYDRLAAALRVDPSATHRARWARGDVAAREEWWQRLPAQPKTWWLNWQDMF